MLSRHWSLPFVLSKIDYWNFLPAGYPKQLTHKLQKVQNNSARLICWTPMSDHISPVLHTLHWLPVEQRIESPCLQICKQQWSVISVWPEVLHSCLTAPLTPSLDVILWGWLGSKYQLTNLWLLSPSHFFIPSEILWTTQTLVSGLCSMELYPDLTPSFLLYICLQICSKDTSFPIPVAFSSLHCDRCVWGGMCVCVCVCVCVWERERERERERVCVCICV